MKIIHNQLFQLQKSTRFLNRKTPGGDYKSYLKSETKEFEKGEFVKGGILELLDQMNARKGVSANTEKRIKNYFEQRRSSLINRLPNDFAWKRAASKIRKNPDIELDEETLEEKSHHFYIDIVVLNRLRELVRLENKYNAYLDVIKTVSSDLNQVSGEVSLIIGEGEESISIQTTTEAHKPDNNIINPNEEVQTTKEEAQKMPINIRKLANRIRSFDGNINQESSAARALAMDAQQGYQEFLAHNKKIGKVLRWSKSTFITKVAMAVLGIPGFANSKNYLKTREKAIGRGVRKKIGDLLAMDTSSSVPVVHQEQTAVETKVGAKKFDKSKAPMVPPKQRIVTKKNNIKRQRPGIVVGTNKKPLKQNQEKLKPIDIKKTQSKPKPPRIEKTKKPSQKVEKKKSNEIIYFGYNIAEEAKWRAEKLSEKVSNKSKIVKISTAVLAPNDDEVAIAIKERLGSSNRKITITDNHRRETKERVGVLPEMQRLTRFLLKIQKTIKNAEIKGAKKVLVSPHFKTTLRQMYIKFNKQKSKSLKTMSKYFGLREDSPVRKYPKEVRIFFAEVDKALRITHSIYTNPRLIAREPRRGEKVRRMKG